jgi:hypothetical protein
MYISEDLAKKIGSLALDFTDENHFNECYTVTTGRSTIYRDFSHQDLLYSIMFSQNKLYNKKNEEGIHMNIMKNGDIFARNFPYYDGELEIIAIYNQEKIRDLIREFKPE